MKTRKYTPPTPEEIEAARVRDEQRKAEKAAEEQRKFDEAMSYRAQFIANASAMATASLYPAELRDSKEAIVRRDIAKKFLDVDAELEAWTKKFMFHPGYEMEWITGRMEAAALWNILSHIVGQISSGKVALVEVLLEMEQELLKRLLNNFDAPTSTAAGHNAYMIAQQDARSKFLRGSLGWWLRELGAKSMIADTMR